MIRRYRNADEEGAHGGIVQAHVVYIADAFQHGADSQFARGNREARGCGGEESRFGRRRFVIWLLCLHKHEYTLSLL